MKNKLLLNKELYNKNSVLDTVATFVALAEISVTEAEQYYELSFRNCKVDEKRIIREFENYALIETIQAAGGLYD